MAEHAYHQTTTPYPHVSNSDREKPLVNKYKKLSQHDSYLATLDSKAYQQRPKAQTESHKLSWKKFLQHKKSQQHAQSHIQLNATGKIEHSQDSSHQYTATLEKMSSQKVYNANNYEIKTGQINLMDSDNTSVKSFDKINENRCGRSDDRDMHDNQHNSICARLESDQPDDTLAGSGLSLADHRLEDASQT